MRFCDLHQIGIFEHFILSPLTQRRVSHMLNMIFFQPFMFGTALAEQMGFNLIDSGYHLIEFNQVDQTARIKVGNADRPAFSFVVQFF